LDRRRFLRGAAIAAAGASWLRWRVPRADAPRPARILILGGTSFLGPALVREAVVAGHTVTLFNRGRTHPELFPQIEKLRGLRSADAAEEDWRSVGTRTWDAVVDVWPFDPALAESAARRLRGQTGRWLYVSSIAAYDKRGFERPGLTEDGALNSLDPALRPYDRGKAESERRLHDLVGERLTIVRPGPIKGDRDDTPDLLAWLRRCQAGGRHIGPGTGSDHVQIVDVFDVARFLVMAIERSISGTFNLTGAPMTFREFTARCAAAVRASSSTEFVWIPREFLHEHGLDPAPFGDPRHPHYLGVFPSWHPEPERAGLGQISSRKALDAGWAQRPFTETASDYLWSIDSTDSDPGWTDELSPEVERRVLESWLSRVGEPQS
jgi:2'-hydroxyisoflavone reductase